MATLPTSFLPSGKLPFNIYVLKTKLSIPFCTRLYLDIAIKTNKHFKHKQSLRKLTSFFNYFFNQASDFADDPPPREKKARTAAVPKAKNGYLSSDDEFDAMVKKETPEKKNGAGNGNANSDSDSESGAPPPAKKSNNGNGKKETNLYVHTFLVKVKQTKNAISKSAFQCP